MWRPFFRSAFPLLFWHGKDAHILKHFKWKTTHSNWLNFLVSFFIGVDSFDFSFSTSKAVLKKKGRLFKHLFWNIFYNFFCRLPFPLLIFPSFKLKISMSTLPGELTFLEESSTRISTEFRRLPPQQRICRTVWMRVRLWIRRSVLRLASLCVTEAVCYSILNCT